MNKLKGFIEHLDESELRFVKRFIEKGEALKLVDQKIVEKRSEEWNRICPVCNSLISNDSITLIFGPEDFRKKASFCATDCLEYFIQKLKQNKNDSIQKVEGEINEHRP
ncbi:hypothetical protein JW711_05405 [Candidatus Woesearchaeota archaeon]|nr:hypothetical protein [Candidatus Woesearchaeota archaeon]